MKIADRAFALTLAAFSLGALVGAVVVASSELIQGLMIALVHFRLVGPVKSASTLGSTVLVLLIFANNSIPVLLSFVYPVIVGKVTWTPPFSREGKVRLMFSLSVFCGFLIGFFNLGAVLSVAWSLGGVGLVDSLLSASWVHGPVEFFLVLVGVSEPLRLVSEKGASLNLAEGVKRDLKLLVVCLIGLLISAVLEVFLHV